LSSGNGGILWEKHSRHRQSNWVGRKGEKKISYWANSGGTKAEARTSKRERPPTRNFSMSGSRKGCERSGSYRGLIKTEPGRKKKRTGLDTSRACA